MKSKKFLKTLHQHSLEQFLLTQLRLFLGFLLLYYLGVSICETDTISDSDGCTSLFPCIISVCFKGSGSMRCEGLGPGSNACILVDMSCRLMCLLKEWFIVSSSDLLYCILYAIGNIYLSCCIAKSLLRSVKFSDIGCSLIC